MKDKRDAAQFAEMIREKYLDPISRDKNETILSGLKIRFILSVAFLAPLVALAEWEEARPRDVMPTELALTLILVAINFRCYIDGFGSIFKGKPEKNTLAAIVSAVAIGILQFPIAGLVLTSMAFCRFLEAYITVKLQQHMGELIDTRPDDSHLDKGDILTVAAGQIIPADGIILSGGSAVDEELITGERVPVRKSDGDLVYAGTRNVSYDITIRVIHTGSERVIVNILRRMHAAAETTVSLTAKTDRTAKILVAAVIGAAILTGILWYVAEQNLAMAVFAGMTVTIIANPYAFPVTLPMTVMAGINAGSRHGILISSAEILEETRDINTIVMNKTGTITAGKPEISDVISIDGSFDLRLAGALEQDADHPFGKVIRQAAEELYGQLPQVTTEETLPSRGLRVSLEGKAYYVGNSVLMDDLGIPRKLPQQKDLFDQGKSVIFFADESRVIGIVALRDAPVPDSLKAISQIEGLGIDVVMVTGDSKETAESIRREVGLDHIFAQIRPDEKRKVVEKIRDEKKKIVAMAGDGKQDASAIEAADLGIAIGSGREIEISQADIVLISNDLPDVVRAIRLSRLVNRYLRQNVSFAFLYNICAVFAAALLLIPFTDNVIAAVIACLCMCSSQILLILSVLRIKRARL